MSLEKARPLITLRDRQPTVQLDYQFITQAKRELRLDESVTEENSKYVTVLCALDTKTGLGLEVIVTKKGNCKIAETELVKFLLEIGRANCILLGDNEPALIHLMIRVVKKLGTGATYRTTPNYSPESKGNCERRHQTTLGQVKTLASDLQARYKLTTPLDIQLPLYRWLVKHCCFLVKRYLLHSYGKN